MKSGRIALVAAMAFAGGRPALAQVQPAPAAQEGELQIHDARLIFLRRRDSPGPDIEYRVYTPEAMAGATFTMDEPCPLVLGEDYLHPLITSTVAPGTWEDGRYELSLNPSGHLFIRHTRDVHEQVDRLLAHLRSLREHRIVVEGTAALVEDALLEAWHAGGDAAAKALDEALPGGRRASLVGSFRCTARNNQRMYSSDLTSFPYTRSYASAAGVTVPLTEYLSLGTAMDICPVIFGDRILCDVRFTRQTGTQAIPSFETGVPGLGPIGLPETSFAATGSAVAGKSGEMLLVARVAAPAPKAAAGAPARSLCFFVRPTIVPVKPVPPPDTGGALQTRLIDVSAFTHRSGWLKAREFKKPDEGPDLPIISTYGMIDLIKRDIAPATWETPGVSLDTNNELLVIRQTPPVVDQVVKWVEQKAPRHFRRIAMRADLLLAGRGTLQALLAKHPGLEGASAAAEADEVSRLIGRDDTPSGVTRLDAADILGVSGQSMVLKRVERFAYVKGYAAGDPSLPEVAATTDGFVLECLPELSDDGKTVRAGLQFYGSRPAPSSPVKDADGRRIRRPAAEEARWNREIVAAAGAPVLVDGGLKATVDGEPRRLLLLVRFQPVP